MPPSSLLQLSVIVPCKNEAAHLLQALTALKNQLNEKGQPLSHQLYEVIVLINNSSDTSFTIAKNFQKLFTGFALHVCLIKLRKKKAHIGIVRRLLMDTAYQRLIQVTTKGIIASTDADTTVDKNWVYNIIKEIGCGCDAVGGRILSAPDNIVSRKFHLRDVRFRLLTAEVEAILDPHIHDPWPRHHQFFGANAAVTCNMYNKAGRLPQVPFLEDAAFYKALTNVDAKVRKTNSVKVYTSTRLNGKVEIGFSEQLSKWHGMHLNKEKQMAEPAEAVIIKFRYKHLLRTCWLDIQKGKEYNARALHKVAANLLIETVWLQKNINAYTYFGELWQQVENKMLAGDWCRKWHLTEITETISKLQSFIKDYKTKSLQKS